MTTDNRGFDASAPPPSALPTPTRAFRWQAVPWGDGLVCEPLASLAHHVFTTRQLQLRSAADSPEAWAQAARAIGGDPSRVIRIRQVHGAAVRIVRHEDDEAAEVGRVPEADAVIAARPGLVLAVQVADCVPLLMADSRTGAVAAVHAGWRGTVAGIARAAVAAMANAFGARPQDLIAALGPSIGPCCYRVGDDLLDAFRAAGASESDLARWFSRDPEEQLQLDLWTANRDQLLAAGLTPERIHLSQLCTMTHADLFESYRVNGPKAGRMAGMIRVPD